MIMAKLKARVPSLDTSVQAEAILSLSGFGSSNLLPRIFYLREKLFSDYIMKKGKKN